MLETLMTDFEHFHIVEPCADIRGLGSHHSSGLHKPAKVPRSTYLGHTLCMFP